VKFTENGKAAVSESIKVPMPGTLGPVSAKTFFDNIAEIISPLIKKSSEPIKGIGFCFSYPMEITKEADGILLAFSKEVNAPEVIGKAIGRELKEALYRQKIKAPERIVLLNDTTATLLSGVSGIKGCGGLEQSKGCCGVQPGPVIGFILGTGINTAYPETKIPKIGFDSDIPQIVVCESGNFAHRYMGLLDREYDQTTNCPGKYTLEKAAAGAYLGPLNFHIYKQAIKDGLIKFKRSAEFLSLPALQTKDLDAWQYAPLAREGPISEFFDKDEKDAIKSLVYLSSIITKRGALLSAAVVAGVVEKTGAGFDPFAPVRITVEGTTFMIYKGLRPALESWLHLMLNKNKPRSYSITPVEQASLFGAAVAALSNVTFLKAPF
jgi:hexokinase